MKPGGVLDNTINITPVFNKIVQDIVYELLENDYKYLDNNNILEEEDGGGSTENKRNKDILNGPQRGYGSGRSLNIPI